MATAANTLTPKFGAAYTTPEGDRVWPLLRQWGYSEKAKKMARFNSIPSYLNEFTLEGAKLNTPKRIPLEVAIHANSHLYTYPVMGTDPEFFIKKRGENHKFPAFMALPSAREHSPSGWFWDGFQAETTVDPAGCHVVLAGCFQQRLAALWKAGFDIDLTSMWKVPKTLLMTAETQHIAFGCAPSKNIYGTKSNIASDPREVEWRGSGGHLHFELSSAIIAEWLKEMVKGLDAILAVPFVAILEGYDLPVRRKTYGLAGEYRLPPHGLEYRTMSNGWLQHPQLFQLATDLARLAVNVSRLGLRKAFLANERHVQDVINYCDVRGAREIFHLNRDFYKFFCDRTYHARNFPFLELAVQQGVRATLKDWDDGAMKNWLSQAFRDRQQTVDAERVRIWAGLPSSY